MATRNAESRLRDILSGALDLQTILGTMSAERLDTLADTDTIAYRSVKNALFEIGEAAKNLPADITARHPDVNWSGFARLRDILAHQYFGVQSERLLMIVQERVPGLIVAITAELANIGRTD